MGYIQIMARLKSVQQRIWLDTLRILRKLSKAMRLSVPTIIHYAVLDYRDRFEQSKKDT